MNLPFFQLVNPTSKGIPYTRTFLSPKQLSYDCDLAIRIATTHNMGHIHANCPKNLEARSHCNTCHKVGHFTSSCPKNRYCMYCNSWGHRSFFCTDPHHFCNGTCPCPIPSSHPLPCCPHPLIPDGPWADYNGQYDAYDNIDWEAQDHSP